MEKTVQFHLEDFDGPLDLLLALVAKNKMSIYDIEILTLIDQYLQVVGEPGPEAMESTSAFITMAARLVQTKSQLLLPRSDEADRMREELTGLLVEYSACKAVAAQLREMAAGIFIVARRPVNLPVDHTYKGLHAPAELAAALGNMAGRHQERRTPRAEQFDDIVTAPIVSVTGRVIYLLRGLKQGSFRRLRECFGFSRSRSETVATFLALLELIRGGRVRIGDNEELQMAPPPRQKAAHRRRQLNTKRSTPPWN
ncbi:MAG: segregation/condensation protein A [Ruminococcaceae bacterium]|nr:segregation/condensation protein A [Oscillospiraceae bacterium]